MPKLLFTLTLATASLITTAQGQTWETVDSIAYLAEGPFAQVDAIAASPDGILYAIGASSSPSGGFEKNYVRRSFDGGTNWQSVASFSPVYGNGIDKLAVDSSSGRLYAAGLVDGLWTVLSSGDQGGTWSTIDSFNTGATSYPELRSITTDADGNVYVAGSAKTSRGLRQWLVRKGVPSLSAPDGVSWTTIDAYTPARNYGARANQVAIKAPAIPGNAAEIYVGGTSGSSSGEQWVVRRSTDGGATWVIVDSVVSDYGSLNTLAVSPDGSIYTSGSTRTVTGSKRNQTTTQSFVVRKGTPNASAPNGISWSTREVLSLVESTGNSIFRAQSSTVDQDGRLFLAGYEVVDSVWNWRIRASFDGGLTFSYTDSFERGVAFCVAADLEGNVFAGGYFGTDISNGGGIIRKLAAPLE